MNRNAFGQAVFEALLLLLTLIVLAAAFWVWVAVAGDLTGGAASSAKSQTLPLQDLRTGAGGAAVSPALTKAATTPHAPP